jgi:hypothetical protein
LKSKFIFLFIIECSFVHLNLQFFMYRWFFFCMLRKISDHVRRLVVVVQEQLFTENKIN